MTLPSVPSCLLPPWSRVLHEKPTGSQPVKTFLAFYGTRRFITAFASARHLSLYQSISPGWRHMFMFLNKASFYGEKSASCPTLKPDGHPLSAVRYCSFDIFAANLPFPLSATCGRTMLWGQGPTYHGTFLITPLVSSKSHLASNCTFIETKYTSLLHACIRMPVTSINAFSFNTGIIMLFLP